MKKCTYCGKEYGDEAEECAIDREPLAGFTPVASSTVTPKRPEGRTQKAENILANPVITPDQLNAVQLLRTSPPRRCVCGGSMIAVSVRVWSSRSLVPGAHYAIFKCGSCHRRRFIPDALLLGGILVFGLGSLLPLTKPEQFNAVERHAYILLPLAALCLFLRGSINRRNYPTI